MKTDGSFAALVFICPRTECAVYLVMYSEPRWRLSCVSPDRLFCRPIAEHQSGWEEEHTRPLRGAPHHHCTGQFIHFYHHQHLCRSIFLSFNANKCTCLECNYGLQFQTLFGWLGDDLANKKNLQFFWGLFPFYIVNFRFLEL